MDVSLIDSVTWDLAKLRFDYNDAGSFALVAEQLRYDRKKDKYGENHQMHNAL